MTKSLITSTKSEYPKRESHFAYKAFRLATKVCLAQEIGPDAVLLLAVIAFQEDAKRYRGPVTFFDSQLQPILGFAKWERLDRARKAAVASGWLQYHRPGRREPGRYFVTVPSDLDGVEDAPIDEGSFPDSLPSKGSQTPHSLPLEGTKTGSNREPKRGAF